MFELSSINQMLALGMPGGSEWIFIVLIVLLLFGGSKIPQLMRGLGKGVSEFQEGIKETKKQLDTAVKSATDDDTRA